MPRKDKEARKQYCREYRRKNWQKLKVLAKKWREKNKGYLTNYKKKRYQDRKEEQKIYARNYRKNHRDIINRQKRARYYKTCYGITIEDYDKLWQQQNGKCGICKIHQSSLTYALHIDHNHQSGEIRKLLCLKCNTALEMFRKNPDLLNRFREYIEEER